MVENELDRKTMDRKAAVLVQGRSDVGRPQGNGNTNRERHTFKAISKAERV